MSLEDGIDNLGEKLASHKWVNTSVYDKFNDKINYICKCSKCGFAAYGEPPTVFNNLYVDILSCDEMTIKDIIE